MRLKAALLIRGDGGTTARQAASVSHPIDGLESKNGRPARSRQARQAPSCLGWTAEPSVVVQGRQPGCESRDTRAPGHRVHGLVCVNVAISRLCCAGDVRLPTRRG